MSIAEWEGERAEFAVRVIEHPGVVVPYVSRVTDHQLEAERNARAISGDGVVAEIVTRLVHYSEWRMP